ncbi:hypothetical protein ABK040_000510 [Willaertia magna]
MSPFHTLESLPFEILIHIFSFLSSFNNFHTEKFIKNLINNDTIVNNLIKNIKSLTSISTMNQAFYHFFNKNEDFQNILLQWINQLEQTIYFVRANQLVEQINYFNNALQKDSNNYYFTNEEKLELFPGIQQYILFMELGQIPEHFENKYFIKEMEYLLNIKNLSKNLLNNLQKEINHLGKEIQIKRLQKIKTTKEELEFLSEIYFISPFELFITKYFILCLTLYKEETNKETNDLKHYTGGTNLIFPPHLVDLPFHKIYRNQDNNNNNNNIAPLGCSFPEWGWELFITGNHNYSTVTISEKESKRKLSKYIYLHFDKIMHNWLFNIPSYEFPNAIQFLSFIDRVESPYYIKEYFDFTFQNVKYCYLKSNDNVLFNKFLTKRKFPKLNYLILENISCNDLIEENLEILNQLNTLEIKAKYYVEFQIVEKLKQLKLHLLKHVIVQFYLRDITSTGDVFGTLREFYNLNNFVGSISKASFNPVYF